MATTHANQIVLRTIHGIKLHVGDGEYFLHLPSIVRFDAEVIEAMEQMGEDEFHRRLARMIVYDGNEGP